jgi:transcriptional regulator with XRE-family HTH domain
LAFAGEKVCQARIFSVRDDVVSGYLAERLRAWMAEDRKSRTQAAVARSAGVSTAQVSNFLDGSRGAGKKTLRGLARAMGTTWPEIEEEAERWARRRGGALAAAREPAHPNLALAIDLTKGAILPETVERIAQIAKLWPHDLSVGEWVDEILRLDGAFRRHQVEFRPTGTGTTKR